MKTLLTSLSLLCLTLNAQAQEWPRSPKTGKVEFTGLLPWPASTKTEAQRRELVRAWYLAKLTDAASATIQEQQRSNQANGLLTYAGLPKAAMIYSGQQSVRYELFYFADLIAAAQGIQYRFYLFNMNGGGMTALEPLESHLLTSSESEQAALAVLRERLVQAVKSWR